MRVSTTLLPLIASALLAVACGGSQPAPEPQPAPATDDAAARARARQDSIDAANRARAEADARARAEAERMAGDAAALRTELLNRLAMTIHFDFDKSDLKSEDLSNLDFKAALLQVNPALRLRIAGHADERGSDEYNLALGNRRAAAAKRYIVNKGIGADRIEVVSFGEERPVDAGHDEGAWARNRRDEFEVVSGADNLSAPK